MELKKTAKADLQQKSGMYFSVGLVITLSLTVLCFEWKSYDDTNIVLLGHISDDFEDLLEIPPTRQPPPPPPKIQQPEIIEVPDEEEIEEIEIDLDVEITEEQVVEEIVFEETEEEVADEIFTIVENKPEFEGGHSAYMRFLQKNIKYPAQARRMGIEGRVFVQFVIGVDGAVSQVVILKGLGAGCDKEAIRVISKSPNWIPGKQRGKPVRVRMVVPLIFSLG
jgi:protein TonB